MICNKAFKSHEDGIFELLVKVYEMIFFLSRVLKLSNFTNGYAEQSKEKLRSSEEILDCNG